MNHFANLSIQFANSRNYLDELFCVYPTIPEGIRELDQTLWQNIEQSFNSKDNLSLITHLFKLDLFPIKDSYVAYLKRDPNALNRNPNILCECFIAS